MNTSASLREYSRDDLADMAKRKGVAGWHSMRKEQLVRALVAAERKSGKKSVRSRQATAALKPGSKAPARNGRAVVSTKANRGNSPKTAPKSKVAAKAPPKNASAVKAPARPRPKSTAVARQIEILSAEREKQRDLSAPAARNGVNSHARVNGNGVKSAHAAPDDAARDRLVLMVRDSYWLHACWELGAGSVARAHAAMAEHWHTARPILRLLEVEKGTTTSSAERVVREIEIHGGVSNWYIDVQDPPKSFRVDIGYKAANGKFFTLSRSNSVTTPLPGSVDAVDENWLPVARDYERVFAMSGGYNEEQSTTELQELFEERLRRPMGSPLGSQYGIGAEQAFPRSGDFELAVDAEMIVFGRTKPNAHVTISGKPIRLRPDGTFTIRQSLPDRRQVLPVVAASSDGVEQRTVVIAVERNTKVMEPYVRDGSE